MDDSQSSHYDYIAVGHVTRDMIEDRAGEAVSQPGGGAFYSGLQAARLGLRTLIVTQGVPRRYGRCSNRSATSSTCASFPPSTPPH